MNELNPKLHKLLAQAGLGSRREIETWISAGRISVNGELAQIGQRVTEDAVITLDQKTVWPLSEKRLALPSPVWMYHKPIGEICTQKDPEGRPTVFAHLPPLTHQRWISVGRLDFNTSGLLLFTTDGNLAQRLMHPAQEIQRVYHVRVYGRVTDDALTHLLTGVLLEDGQARFTELYHLRGDGANNWFSVGLKEGRYHEVRRLWESQGVAVNRLVRVKFGQVSLPQGLKAGRGQFLTTKDCEKLYNLAGLATSS